jgi:hypothetical protein
MTEKIPPVNETLQENSNLNPEKGKRVEVSPVAMEDLKNLKSEIGFRRTKTAEIIRDAQAKKELGDEPWDSKPMTVYNASPKQAPSNKFRNGIMALKIGLAGLLGLGATKEAKAGGDPVDSLGKKATIEKVLKNNEDSLKNKSNVKVYTSSKTKEGATTPTGLSNSFLENSYGVTESDIPAIANYFGFSTENNAAFQRDMYNYLKENKPELIKEILEKYGQTQKGGSIDKNASLEEQIKGLIDGNLGVRDAFTIAQLKKILETIQEIQKSSPQEIMKEIPQPEGNYVINVRGDESGSKGVYFFFKTEDKFREATDKIGHYISREVKGGHGQATINMNADVFVDRYANGKEDLLGIAWERDGNKQYKFFTKETKNTTANYTDGFVKTK